ncbi:hypothetical protein REPUB_Repub11eG0096100 [Reevesia pubescens]
MEKWWETSLADDISLLFDGCSGCNGDLSLVGSGVFRFAGDGSDGDESVDELKPSEDGTFGELPNVGRGLLDADNNENVCALYNRGHGLHDAAPEENVCALFNMGRGQLGVVHNENVGAVESGTGHLNFLESQNVVNLVESPKVDTVEPISGPGKEVSGAEHKSGPGKEASGGESVGLSTKPMSDLFVREENRVDSCNLFASDFPSLIRGKDDMRKKRGRWVWDCFPKREKNKFISRIKVFNSKVENRGRLNSRGGENSGDSFSSWNISDDGIKLRNRSFVEKVTQSEVAECMEFGKHMGLVLGEKEEEFASRLQEMEIRDEEGMKR